MFTKFIILLSLTSSLGLASVQGAKSVFDTRLNKTEKLRKLVIELAESGYHYAAIPWMKEYLVRTSSSLDRKLEGAFEKILTNTGTKQFELLPIKYLVNSSSDSLSYVLSKKYYKNKKYNEALSYVKKIDPNHPIYPFANHLTANIYSALGKQSSAISFFKDCERSSQSRLGQSSGVRAKQLKLNRDYCILGTARAHFAAKEYNIANLKYLDIPKSSPVWPEILFEEAWNSYYLGNFNRTLGKLVTYNAPVFDYIFNPEIEVLNALSYLKMCLYDDAKRISDDFWNKFLIPTRKLRNFLNTKGNNSKYFYRLIIDFEKTNNVDNELMAHMLKSIKRDGAFLEIRQSLKEAISEYELAKKFGSSKFKTSILSNLNEVINTQKAILGAYVRSILVSKYAQLYRTFEGMSYIKLEVLQRLKQKLYSFKEKSEDKRGDVKFIERNEKQYFWNFNGEFWADELGDYVFALKTECN